MLTRPIGVSQFTAPGQSSNLIPVRPALWKYLITAAAATQILERVRALPGATVTLVDADPNNFFFDHLLEPGDPNDARQMEIHGTMQIAGNDYSIDETAGWLFDRLTRPDASVDHPRSSQGDQSIGGNVLKFDAVDSADVELYWGH